MPEAVVLGVAAGFVLQAKAARAVVVGLMAPPELQLEGLVALMVVAGVWGTTSALLLAEPVPVAQFVSSGPVQPAASHRQTQGTFK